LPVLDHFYSHISSFLRCFFLTSYLAPNGSCPFPPESPQPLTFLCPPPLPLLPSAVRSSAPPKMMKLTIGLPQLTFCLALLLISFFYSPPQPRSGRSPSYPQQVFLTSHSVFPRRRLYLSFSRSVCHPLLMIFGARPSVLISLREVFVFLAPCFFSQDAVRFSLCLPIWAFFLLALSK